jgi:radical SAM superfamily enzyme YgiQ (UPF0313 family)
MMPPLGIGYLLKALQNIPCVQPVFIDCQRENLSDRALLGRLRRLGPALVGVQVFSSEYVHFRRLLGPLRRALPGAILLAGGPHVAGLPEQTLRENPHLDFAVVGEGEPAVRALAEAILAGDIEARQGGIANLVYRRDGGFARGPKEWIDVNEFGQPAWDLLAPDRYPPLQHGTFHRGRRVAPVLTSRGCPHGCTFCAGHLLTGKNVRLRNPASIADEIEMLQRRYGVDEILIEDENFTFDRGHAIGLADEIRRRGLQCRFSLPNGIRLDNLDEELVRRLRDMGVYYTLLGIESGSPETLRRMGKCWDLRMIREKVALLKRYGIITLGSFIVGFRDETLRDVRRTIDFAMSCGVDRAVFGNYLPLPGTADFEVLRKTDELRLDDICWENYTFGFGELPYHPRDIPAGQLRRAILAGTAKFYLRPGTLVCLFREVALRPIYWKNLLFRAHRLFADSQAC